MKKVLNTPKRMGRPPTGGPLKRPINVMLDSRVAEGLRVYGDDNLSKGVELAAKNAFRADKAELAALPDVRVPLAEGRKPPGNRKTKKSGRPVAGLSHRVRTTIQMYPELVEELRTFGDGIVSRGIERAALLSGATRL